MTKCVSKPPFDQMKGYDFRIFPHLTPKAKHEPGQVPCSIYRVRDGHVTFADHVVESLNVSAVGCCVCGCCACVDGVYLRNNRFEELCARRHELNVGLLVADTALRVTCRRYDKIRGGMGAQTFVVKSPSRMWSNTGGRVFKLW